MNDFNDATFDVSNYAEKWGIEYPVKITDSLKKALTPNDFLAGLGIQFSQRLNNIIGSLKGSLVPIDGGPAETMTRDGVAIPYAITQGPFVREMPITIIAERRKDDDGNMEIVLSIIQDEE
jgi:hypothetical protein